MSSSLKQVASNIWELTYPLSLVGAELGRRVTIVRLASGKLIIHSTGPFTGQDIAAIRSVGTPAWVVDVTLNHDTFADIGRAAFPEIPYGVPEGFIYVDGERFDLSSPPGEWQPEIETLELAGMPRVREFVFLHRPTRTLIVADLLFNFETCSKWTRQVFRWLGGIKEYPGMSRLFVSLIKDKGAFAQSIEQMLDWDFDRLMVAHGQTAESGGKALVTRALRNAGVEFGARRQPQGAL